MFKDSRPTQTAADTASTPDMWAETFAASTRMNRWRDFRFSLTGEWKLIRRHVPLGGTILDAGCGFGEWVSFLSNHGYRPQGLDYSSELISRLRRTYPDLAWTEGEITRLPFSDSVFDAVISWGVIEHDEAGPSAALAEFHRVLKPGGTAIVTVPIDSPLQRRSADYLHHRSSGHQTFFQYFMTRDELEAHVHNAGFEVIQAALLPNAVLHLVSPRLTATLRGFWFRLANFLVSTFLSRIPRYCIMQYCVGRKRSGDAA